VEELKAQLENNSERFTEEKTKLVLELHEILMDYHNYLLQMKKQESKGFLSLYALAIKSLILDDLDNKNFFKLIQGKSNIRNIHY
jgi:hypothetical protein